MPRHAFLCCHKLICPYCGQQLVSESATDSAFIKFQWGNLPSRYPTQPQSRIYQVGESIYWRPSKDGTIRAWVGFSDDQSINAGDPEIHHLIITETGADIVYFPYTCSICKQTNGGGALKIFENVIVKAWAFKANELIPGYAPLYRRWRNDLKEWINITSSEAFPHEIVTEYLVNSDGSLTPKPEWADRTLSSWE